MVILQNGCLHERKQKFIVTLRAYNNHFEVLYFHRKQSVFHIKIRLDCETIGAENRGNNLFGTPVSVYVMAHEFSQNISSFFQ